MSCTFRAREVSWSWSYFLQMPVLTQTLRLIERGPATQCQDPALAMHMCLNLSSSSPNSRRHSGVSPQDCPNAWLWDTEAMFPLSGSARVSLSMRVHHLACICPEREAGAKGPPEFQGSLPTPFDITPQVVPGTGKPVSPLETSLNSRVLDARQLWPQPSHGILQGAWGFALHHHVSLLRAQPLQNHKQGAGVEVEGMMDCFFGSTAN